MNKWRLLGVGSTFGVLAALGAHCGAPNDASTAEQVRGAAYTTFDAEEGGCLQGNHPNGINCNHYDCGEHVFVTGGPNRRRGGNTLENGEYFFAILTPGSQNGGAADGASGNLSDDFDTFTDRRFRMQDGALTNLGTHDVGMTPNGQVIVRAWPFAQTTNPGGVYILAICPIVDGTPLTHPRYCKFDAFKADICAPEDGGKKDHEDDEKKDHEDDGKKNETPA